MTSFDFFYNRSCARAGFRANEVAQLVFISVSLLCRSLVVFVDWSLKFLEIFYVRGSVVPVEDDQGLCYGLLTLLAAFNHYSGFLV
ncbi:hypothetical protein V6N13_028219 [Hibiscus sabdariffa]